MSVVIGDRASVEEGGSLYRVYECHQSQDCYLSYHFRRVCHLLLYIVYKDGKSIARSKTVALCVALGMFYMMYGLDILTHGHIFPNVNLQLSYTVPLNTAELVSLPTHYLNSITFSEVQPSYMSCLDCFYPKISCTDIRFTFKSGTVYSKAYFILQVCY